MKYVVTLAGRDHEVVVNGGTLTIGDRTCQAHLEMIAGTPLCHLLLDGHSYTFAVSRGADGRWTLLEAGDAVEVDVTDERTRYIRSLAGAGKTQQGGGVLKAPMPGLVVKVLVEPGENVTAGQSLVVLEAMKMENELKAPSAALVGTVSVRAGQAVEKGQALVALEPMSAGPVG